MVKLFKELQPVKAWSPIWVTDFGMVKLVNEVQERKAPSPIWVTDSGMVKLVKELQPEKSFVSNLSHRLRDGQTRQRGACTKCTISNLSHKPRDGQTRQRAAASMISNPSHRLRDNQSQQASASFESIFLDGCFSARDAYVTQFRHPVAKFVDTLNCRLDIEDNLHFGRVEDRIWDGHLKIIQLLPWRTNSTVLSIRVISSPDGLKAFTSSFNSSIVISGPTARV